MPALIIIGVGYAGLCAFVTAAFVLAGRADDATDQALGDWPNLPADAKVAGDRNLVRGGEARPKQSPAEYEIAPHRKAK